MSVGFRKSLFGFKQEDVFNYIQKMHKSFSQKEKDFSDKLLNINNDLNNALSEQSRLLAEKQELERKLDEFNAKYEEIERLSENIGKLYLVAQTNSQAIIDNSKTNAQLSAKEVSNNLFTIAEAHKSLQELRANISRTTQEFVNEVDNLLSSLNDTREQIANNSENINNAVEDFEIVYNSIVK